MNMKNIQVVWFKRDLRISDHAPLFRATESGPVLPLYVVEPAYWQLPDTSARQWSFIRESLLELRNSLYVLGQPLIIRIGSATDVFSDLNNKIRFSQIWSHQETGNDWTFSRDQQVADWCRVNSILWTELPQNGVIRGLSNRDDWAKRWDTFMFSKNVPTPKTLSAIPQLDPGPIPEDRKIGLEYDFCPARQVGGRSRGLELLDSFLSERGRRYRSGMSSPITAETACSRLSPHTAYGTLSLREILKLLAKIQNSAPIKPHSIQRPSRQNLSSFKSRLHWHCHFMQKMEDQPEIEWKNLHPAYYNLRRENNVILKAWSRAETGWPFVDACMRMLQKTGWINFRMRAMLIAVASYHLWLKWREPGEHLASLFTDYEPGIHWPQVQMQSGTTGINLPRIYNPIKQGMDQDPSGTFIRRWVPELDMVPDQWLHTPWRWDNAPKRLSEIYPNPIVDHTEAAKMARQKVWEVRKGDSFKRVAAQILAKHGSRRINSHKRFKPRVTQQSSRKSKRKPLGKQFDLFETNTD